MSEIGSTDEAEAVTGNGSVIALLKRQRTLLGTIVVLLGTGFAYVGTRLAVDAVTAVATAAPPVYTEGASVKLSTDLLGNLRLLGGGGTPGNPLGGFTDSTRRIGRIDSLTLVRTVDSLRTIARVVVLDSLRHVVYADSVRRVGRMDSVSLVRTLDSLRSVGRVLVDSAFVVRWFGSSAPTVGQKTMAASLPVTLASDQTALATTIPALLAGSAHIGRVAVDSILAVGASAPLHVTGTAAVNTGLTVTLPAAGAGLFHYITSIQWVKRYSVIGVAAGAGVIITSTNLPGNPAWDTEQLAGAAGTVVLVINYQPTRPLRSSVANTATTIVAPAQLQTIWRGNVSYYVGP